MNPTRIHDLFAFDRATALLRAIALLLAVGGALAQPASAAGQEAPDGRVMVVGFDGADWRMVARMMGEGKLPNMAALAERGAAGPLVSTHPAESAAGWVAINTGANPAKNGVPSFVVRNLTGDGVVPGRGDVDATIRTIDTAEDDGAPASFLRSLHPALVAAALGLLAALVLRLLFRAGWAVAVVIGAGLGVAGYFAADRTAARRAGRPDRIPFHVVNKVELDGFWTLATAAGAPALSLQAPMAFGRPGAPGERTLFGLGIPDVRGAFNGDWFVYTDNPNAAGRTPLGAGYQGSGTGTQFRVDFEGVPGGTTESFSSFLYGPINFLEASELLQRFEEIDAIFKDKERFDRLPSQRVVELGDERREVVAELAERRLFGTLQDRIHNHRMALPLRVQRPTGGGDLTVTIGEESQTVREGEWSDFFSLEFAMSPSYSVHAITRVRQVRAEPFELYVDTLQFDPRQPSEDQPVSVPPGFAPGMAEAIGEPFETLGWGCMTNQVKDLAVPLPLFLEDVEFTMGLRRRLFSKALEDDRWRVLYAVFASIDRVQHLMMHLTDPEHPRYDPEAAAQTIELFGETVAMGEVIELMYRQVDEVVGEAMAAARGDDLLLLCADHGFTSYRRGMHVNSWLLREGFLALKSSGPGGAGLADIDWSRTRAYSLGFGMVFLNLEGREPQGIVKPDEADEILATIRARFLTARDGETLVGAAAVPTKDLYTGAEPWGTAAYRCADLMLEFTEFYRVSWESVTGRMPGVVESDGTFAAGDLFADNQAPWTGDHVSNDPSLVTGIFFSNRPVTGSPGSYSVFQIAPTVLAYLGVPMAPQFDGEPLEVQR